MKSVLSIALPLALSLTLLACSENTAVDQDASQSSATAKIDIRDIEAADVNDLLDSDKGAVVLDVRTTKEFEEGHIDGAVSVDFLSEDFAQVLAGLDRDRTYILHCKSGSRSTKALEVMKEQGFTSVAHLISGYDGWKAYQEQSAEAE